MYYQDEVVDKIYLKTTGSICRALGFELGNSWEAYVTALPKVPWNSMYISSLEREGVRELNQAKKLHGSISIRH